ncbi:MAG TPA: hypothetical protein VHP38_06710, partial [Ruminiclostridium sp.]|nr:hypothetical protein [Ruminiclostridium sp.]
STFEQIYSDETYAELKRLEANRNDLQGLTLISDGIIKVKHFEFDNERFASRKAEDLVSALQKEVKEQERWLKEIDAKDFLFNYHQACQKGELMKDEYVRMYRQIHFLLDQVVPLKQIYERSKECIREMSMVTKWTAELAQSFGNRLASIGRDFKDYLDNSDALLFRMKLKPQSAEILDSIKKNGSHFFSGSIQAESINKFYALITECYGRGCEQYEEKLRELADFQLQLRY